MPNEYTFISADTQREILKLLAIYAADGWDVVSGWRHDGYEFLLGRTTAPTASADGGRQ